MKTRLTTPSVEEQFAPLTSLVGVNIQIDRIRILAPCTHKPLGKVVYLDEPEVDLVATGATAKQFKLKDEGEKAYVRSKEVNDAGDTAYMLEIHCCPPLVLQRHNVFGHGVLQDYVYAILNILTKRLGIKVDPMERAEWRRGGIRLTEIHLTVNFACPQSAVVDIIQAIDDNNPCGKYRPIPSSITLGYGDKRRSKYHMLTIYAKELELKSKASWKNPGEIRSRLLAEAAKGIRAEVKLYSQELAQLDLGFVMRWKNVDVAALFFKFLGKYKINYAIQPLLTEDELGMLTKRERMMYALWLRGEDIADHCSRTTAWKYAKAIKDKTQISILEKRRPDALPQIDLKAIFSPENVLPVPEWAIGTEYYFEPGQTDFKAPRTRPGGIAGVPVDPNAVDEWIFAYGEWRMI